MSPGYRKIGLVLAAMILAGGLLVAFLGYPPTSPGAAPMDFGSGGGTVALQGDSGSGSLSGSTFQVSTVTQTTTATYTMSSTTSVSSSTGSEGGSTAYQQSQAGTPNNGRFIEFSSGVSLQVASPASAYDKAISIAYSLGGYVAYSTLMNATASVVLRVPSQNYQDALRQVESLGTVLGATSTSNDVTVEYTDLNATLVSLTTERASLLKLLDQSTDINSTIKLEGIIQQVNAQVNQVQSEILQTQRLISYGTISVSMEKAPPPRAPLKPLTLKLTATPKSGQSPLSVTFNAIVAGGSSPYIVNYNFGDGTSSEGQTLIHTFGQPGDYNVTLTATDSLGNVSETWMPVRVASPSVTSGAASFPSYVGGLFLQVVEGIVSVAVVVLPVAGVAALVLIPLRRWFGGKRGPNKSEPPQSK